MSRLSPQHLPVAFLAFVLAACATPTAYAPATDGGYGFASQKIENDRYRISFRGNSLTDRDTVETYLLFHAAQVTLANGFDYFVVTKDDTERSVRYTVVPDALGFGGPFYGPYGGFGRPFPYYGYGYGRFGGLGYGGLYNDPYIRSSDRYAAIAFISLGRGQKPADLPTAYDASEVRANLAPVVRLPEGADTGMTAPNVIGVEAP